MAIDKITKKINLRLSDKLTEAQRSAAKKEAGQFVVEEILRSVSDGDSPVEGRGAFEKLNKEYAKAEKGGNTNPNLELDGDMLDALEFKETDAGIEVGIFKSSEVPKADGHNNFSGKSKLPTRRFIPKGSEKFDDSIQDELSEITREYNAKVKDKPKKKPTDPFKSILAVEESARRVDIQVGDLFNDDFLDSFLKDEGFI